MSAGFALPRRRRAPRDAGVAMINVVFLLLVFFLMMAQLAPPAPFEIDPPEGAAGAAPEAAQALHVDAEGRLAYGAARDGAALERVAEQAPEPLVLRADAALSASALSDLLTALGEAGVTRVTLVTEGS